MPNEGRDETGWTEERIDRLGKLWQEGSSTAAIGKLLGISKNAVVGKVHRLKLKGRPSPISGGSRSPQPKQKAPPRIYTMEDLSSQTCRWPSGDPQHEDFQFCGRPPTPGKPYCAKHCDAGYATAKPKPKPAS